MAFTTGDFFSPLLGVDAPQIVILTMIFINVNDTIQLGL